MIDVLNISTVAPLAKSSSSLSSSRASQKEADGGSTVNGDNNQGYAEAAESVESKEADGKSLPDSDKDLPVSELDELLADSAEKVLNDDMEELDIFQGDSIDSLPSIPVDLQSASNPKVESMENENLIAKKIDGVSRTPQTSAKGELDFNTTKLDTTLSSAGAKEQSLTDTRDMHSFDKRPISTDLKTVTQNRPEVSVPGKVSETGWSEGVAQRVMMLINQRNSMARIHVNPPELGPVEVRLNVNHDQASVQFLSHSSQVRDALEQSIPRLRDMLETAGLELADSHVGEQSHSESDDSHSGSTSSEGDSADEGANEQGVRVSSVVSEGLLDAYA